MEISLAIRMIMESKQISQLQLSKDSGIPRSYIYKIINGYHAPSILIVEKIATVLGMRASELLAFAENLPPEKNAL